MLLSSFHSLFITITLLYYTSNIGLGQLPQNIPSIGSLLLYNTSINPYRDYQMTLDNLVYAAERGGGGSGSNKKENSDDGKSMYYSTV